MAGLVQSSVAHMAGNARSVLGGSKDGGCAAFHLVSSHTRGNTGTAINTGLFDHGKPKARRRIEELDASEVRLEGSRCR